MPLKKGKSKKTFNANVRELMETYRQKGAIGATSPKSLEHARQIALAIAFNVKGGGRKKRKRGRKK